jgi:peptidoglycan/LPS O-acetylase OafA/YrhL
MAVQKDGWLTRDPSCERVSGLPSIIPVQRHIPALDGLRGLAISMVIVGHLGIAALNPIAQLGVNLFFVLSGYLITGILTRQADEGGVSFLAFYRRRVRRLIPALLPMLGVAAILQGSNWWHQTWQALLYVGNWEPMHGAPLGNITHIWSLAVEEHFYLLWPLVIALIPARHRFKVVGLLTFAFAMWRIGLAASGAGGDRLYYGTDMNAFALLAGCLISIGRFPTLSRMSGYIATGAFFILGMFGEMTAGMLIAAIPLATVMVYVASKGLPVLEVSWIRWFGTVSYGMYLWHMLIPPLWMIPGAVVAGWLSWRLIEQPIIEGRRPRFVLPRRVQVATQLAKAG